MSKLALYFIVISAISGFVILDCFGQAILNPGFELYDEPLQGEGFFRPTHWYSENYAAVHRSFIPEPEHGQTLQWLILDNNILPYKDEYYVLLSTDDIGPDGSEEHALITQDVNFTPSHTLEFYYFFGACDYMPFGDFATANLIVLDPNTGRETSRREIFKISVEDVGSFGSTGGWIQFSYYFDPNDGDFNRIEFKVEDYSDTIYKTYFAVDAIRLGFKPEAGDLDDDWQVDFTDYSILVDYWMQDCNDPNEVQGADIDDNGIVDNNDLLILTDNWLVGTENIF